MQALYPQALNYSYYTIERCPEYSCGLDDALLN
jgi:hypothetical protein